MKTLLLNPPGSFRYIRDYYCSHISKGRYYWPPLDLQILSGHLVHDHEVIVIDAIIEELSPCQTLRTIELWDPDVVFVMTGSVSWLEDKLFLERLTRTSRWKTFILGDIALFEPALCFDFFPFIDGILSDFISPAIHHLLLENDTHEGLGYLTRRGFTAGLPFTPFPETGEFEYPLSQYDLFPEKKYHLAHLRHHPFASVLSDFGCPFTCSFCPYERIPWRIRNCDNLFEELVYHHERGVREIWFKDQSFGAHREHTQKILTGMLEEKLLFDWSCETRMEFLTAPMLELMKATGCHTVMIGIESASENVRCHYGKKYSDESIRDTIVRCHRFNIKVLTHFIIGLPGETAASLGTIPQYAASLGSDYATFNIATAEYGTSMREQALHENWLDRAAKNLDSSCSYPELVVPGLNREMIWDIHQKALQTFYLRPLYIFLFLLSLKTTYQWKNFFFEGWSLIKALFLPKLGDGEGDCLQNPSIEQKHNNCGE